MDFRPWPKVNFCRFLFVGHGRNAFFSCSFRPWPKLCFCCFSLIGRGRKPIFRVSSAADECFFAISAFRLRAMNSFQRFPLVAYKRNAVFRIFCISLTSDEQFSLFSILPRGGKYSLRHFSVFPNVGKLIFAVFHVSQCWDDHFFRFSCFPNLGKSIFTVFLSSQVWESIFLWTPVVSAIAFLDIFFLE